MCRSYHQLCHVWQHMLNEVRPVRKQLLHVRVHGSSDLANNRQNFVHFNACEGKNWG